MTAEEARKLAQAVVEQRASAWGSVTTLVFCRAYLALADENDRLRKIEEAARNLRRGSGLSWGALRDALAAARGEGAE